MRQRKTPAHLSGVFLFGFLRLGCTLLSRSRLGRGCGGVFNSLSNSASRRCAGSFSPEGWSDGFSFIQAPYPRTTYSGRGGKTNRGPTQRCSMLVEDALRVLLLSGMIKLTSDMRKDLFGPQRPLESFSARIAIAHAFGLLDKRSYTHLTVIKDVRNTFAHAPRVIKFHTPEIWRLTGKLKAANMLLVYSITPTDHHQSGLLSAPRNLFLTMCRFYEKSLRATAETRRAS